MPRRLSPLSSRTFGCLGPCCGAFRELRMILSPRLRQHNRGKPRNPTIGKAQIGKPGHEGREFEVSNRSKCVAFPICWYLCSQHLTHTAGKNLGTTRSDWPSPVSSALPCRAEALPAISPCSQRSCWSEGTGDFQAINRLIKLPDLEKCKNWIAFHSAKHVKSQNLEDQKLRINWDGGTPTGMTSPSLPVAFPNDFLFGLRTLFIVVLI